MNSRWKLDIYSKHDDSLLTSFSVQYLDSITTFFSCHWRVVATRVKG